MARPRSTPLTVDGVDLPLDLIVSPRARRLALRLDPAAGTVRVVAPATAGAAEIARFVARHAGWVASRLAALPDRRPFADAAAVPFLGVDHVVRHVAGGRRPVERTGGEFRVAGGREHLPRRLRDYLAAQARRELSRRSRAKAAAIGRAVAAVAVRDQTSRWGSCSPTGRLNYSWRLILAPETVLDYVVAHEVAHLAEMNHGPRFWRLVETLHDRVPDARAWLKTHGAALHRYG